MKMKTFTSIRKMTLSQGAPKPLQCIEFAHFFQRKIFKTNALAISLPDSKVYSLGKFSIFTVLPNRSC